MRDGLTEELRSPSDRGLAGFLKTERAKLVVIVGMNAGEELELNRDSLIIGRGPNVNWTIKDAAISRQHAAVEFSDDRFRIRDLGSKNGILFNGKPVQEADLTDGDRVRIGEHEFQLVIEPREAAAEIFEL